MIGPASQQLHPASSSAAVAAARQALATANAAVDQDRRNHSPSCVAVDQKLVDKAQQDLAACQSSQPQQAMPGTTLNTVC